MGAPTTTRFTNRRRLGEGGMGVVYEAFDEERRARVALKTLKRVDGDALARFKREFRALQGLAHPNLVALDELFFENGEWFFTMELLDGVDFVSHVTEAAPFDEAKLRDALKQLLAGLSALHAVNKVHRDIKPSNVVVTREGRVVLLDFGLVTEASPEDRSSGNAVVGTPAYMAPEQAASLDVGAAADLYAVGVMLYEALTRRLPIEGSHLQMLLAKQTREPEPPASIVPAVPGDLNALCMKMLRFNPVQRPSAGEALRALSAPRPSGAPQPRTTTEASIFVGRDGELAQLRAAFDLSRSELATALVCGESGIGKSYLVRRFTAQLVADHPETMLLEGRCYERETVPYKTLDGVVDALSRRLSRMTAAEAGALLPTRCDMLAQVFPAMRRIPQVAKEHATHTSPLEPHELRQRAFFALRDLFTRVAMRRPTVIVIDDLQWADDDGLRALGEILRPPDAPPLLLVGTVRLATDEDAGLRRVRAVIPGEPRVIELASLGHDDARALAAAFLSQGDGTDGDPEMIASEAGGHPLFVEELSRHVALGGRARDGTPASGGQRGPHLTDVKLDDAIWSRIEQLDGPTRQMAEIVAVAGKPVPQEVVAAAAGFKPAELSRRGATLRVSNVVRTSGTRWTDAIEPYHDRVREAVLAQLSPARRRALHEALASAFESATTRVDPETLATHWHGAENDARAAACAVEAGDQAMKTFAFERATEWYEWALAWLPKDHTDLRGLRVKAGDALAHAGRGALAARHFAAAAEGSPPMQALDLRRRAAEELLSAGRFDEGDEVLKSVLADVGINLPRTPFAALAGLLFFRFLLLVRGLRFRERGEEDLPGRALTRMEACDGVGRILALVDTIRGAYFQTRALWTALSLGEPNRVAYALAIEAVYVATGGDAARSAKLVETAQGITQRTGNARLNALVNTSAGFASFVLGRFKTGLERCDRSAAVLRDCPGAWWELRTAQMAAIWAVGWMGDLGELARRVEQGVREARVRGDIYAGTALRTGVPNLTWLRTGDVAEARSTVHGAMEQWTQRGYHAQHYWRLLALTRIDLYEGDARAAHDRIAGEWSQVVRSLIPQVRIMGAEALQLRGGAALARAAEAKGTERAGLIRTAERDARKLRAMGWDLATAFAQIVDAGAAALRDDRDRAARELDAARKGCEALDLHLHGASVERQLGKLRGGDEGSALVAHADAWMKGEGVVDCGSMAAMIAPGFPR